MDNQQATNSIFLLGYFVAALEGEGTIGCYKGDKLGRYYKPTLKINNTEYSFIEKCMEACEALEFPYHVHTSHPKLHKPCYALTIEGYKRLDKVLPKLIPFMVSKKKQAEILLDIIKIRLAIPMTKGNSGREFGEKEKELVKQIQSLNSNKGGWKNREDR